MKKLFVSVVFFFLLITPKNIYAQWSNDPNQNLRISNFGYFVDACEDGMGGVFVGWKTGNTFYPTVWLQWIDKYGYVKWNTPIHMISEGETQLDFRLVKTEPGKVIVCFIDAREVGMDLPPVPVYSRELIIQKIDTSGMLLWGSRGIKITTKIDKRDTLQKGAVDIVSDGEFGAYATWLDCYGNYYSYDSSIIRMQRIGSEGQRLWGDEGKYIDSWNNGNASGSFLGERKPDGVFLLYRKQNAGNTIVSFNSDMTTRWVKTNSWYPYNKLIPDENGGAAWARFVYPAIWDSGFYLAVNRMNAEGDLLWNDSGIVLERKLPNPGIVVQRLLKNEKLIILYSNYLQMIDRNGQLINKYKFFYGDTTKEINGMAIFPSDSSNFIVAWLEKESGIYQYKCQKFNEALQRVWTTDITFSRTTQVDRMFTSDDRGGFIDVFGVYYPDAPGILAQQVSSNGILGEVLTTINNDNIDGTKTFHLSQNYPNPFNPSTIITFQLPKSGNVTLKIFDILGNEVKILVNEQKEMGRYTVQFDASSLASGMYIYRLRINDYTSAKKMLLLK